MSQSQIVILTDRSDAHVSYVTRHISCDVVLIDPQDLAKGKELVITHNARGATVQFDGQKLIDVVGVWYRKPQPVKDLPVPKEMRAFSESAIERLYTMLLVAFPDAVWVSDYYAALRASHKLLQLEVARKLGFAITETLITGSPSAAQLFLTEHPKSITKRLATHAPTINGKRAMFLTTKITDSFTPDLTNLHLAPAIFQSAIDVKHDIRLTVVGDQVFAAYIRSQELADQAIPIRDSRVGFSAGDILIEPAANLPNALIKRCVEHTKALGLNFAALDIIEDISGEYWFIESNAGGQWAYVEEATKQPIGKAIADLLQDGKHKITV